MRWCPGLAKLYHRAVQSIIFVLLTTHRITNRTNQRMMLFVTLTFLSLLIMASVSYGDIGSCFRGSNCQNDPRQPSISVSEEPCCYTIFKNVACASKLPSSLF